MTTELATRETNISAELMESVVIEGDLSKLTPAERLNYYQAVCRSLGLNPLTKPFQYLRLNNKLVLYALRDATEQLRRIHHISTTITSREAVNGVYVVTAKATARDGRTDESIGAVSIDGLKGEALANAYMKSESKSKRRVTLSIVGLGWLDETEVESIPEARIVPVDHATGELPAPAKEKPNPNPRHQVLETARTWNRDNPNAKVQTAEILKALEVMYGYQTKNLEEGLALLNPDQQLELVGFIANGELLDRLDVLEDAQGEEATDLPF